MSQRTPDLGTERPSLRTVVVPTSRAESALLATLRGVEVTRSAATGTLLRGLELQPEAPSGASPLVLLHGRGHAALMFAPVIQALAQTRTVLAFDLPGQGHSAIAAPRANGQDAALATLVDPVEAALSDRGAVTLVGHSLGGLVALEIALRGRIDVDRLVLINPMGLSADASTLSRVYLSLGLGRWTSTRLGKSAIPDPNLARFRRDLARRPVNPIADQVFRTLFPLTGPVASKKALLGGIKVPTVIIGSRHDPAFSYASYEEAARALPRGRLLPVNEGHSPHVEAPVAFVSALRQALDF